MAAIESDNELTVPAALAANKQKTARKSAKGRKLMRWGPDEDQQLLLATEAVIIEGTVELDWNLVGEKMPQKVTGEAIKQHLCKVREARESAGMLTPTKAEGKSAFGTRRGVTRYPPVDPNANPDLKKRARPESKISRGKGKKARGKEDGGDSDDEFMEEKPKGLPKIKHRSLLFGPAVPREDNSPTPVPDALVIKLSAKKRKIKEEPQTRTDTVTTPKAPRKRAKKVKTNSEAVVSGESPSPSPVKPSGRKALGSNFSLKDRVEQLEKLKRESRASQAIDPYKENLPTDIAAVKVATGSNGINADVRKYFKPAMKKVVESNRKRPVGLVNTPVHGERALRVKATRPNYREDKADLSDDQQSELAVGADNKDDMYEPEDVAGDDFVFQDDDEQAMPINNDADMFADDFANPMQFEEATGPEPKQKNFQSDDFLQSTAAGDRRWEGENVFVEMPGFVRQDVANFPTNPGSYFDFSLGMYNDNPVPADNRAWYETGYEQSQQPAPMVAPASAPTPDLPFQWGSLQPYQTNKALLDGFNSSHDSFPQYNESDVLVERLNTDEMQEGSQINEGRVQEGGQNLGVYGNAEFNGQWSYDPSEEFELLQ